VSYTAIDASQHLHKGRFIVLNLMFAEKWCSSEMKFALIWLYAKSSATNCWLADVAISPSDDTAVVRALAEVLPVCSRWRLRVLVGRAGG
jgi:hypothetical protein